MAYTVGELKEALDDYGDHLPVAVVVTNSAGAEKSYLEIDVETDSFTGEPRVVLAVED